MSDPIDRLQSYGESSSTLELEYGGSATCVAEDDSWNPTQDSLHTLVGEVIESRSSSRLRELFGLPNNSVSCGKIFSTKFKG